MQNNQFGAAIWGCMLVSVGCLIVYYDWFQEYSSEASPSMIGPETALWRMDERSSPRTGEVDQAKYDYLYWALINCQCKFVDASRSPKGYFFMTVCEKKVGGLNCWEATRWLCGFKALTALATIFGGLIHLGVVS
uniref:Uncharacterized protein n=1 Tax=Hemiselmis andersenii TaxID=464988 RepID=A0A6T8PMP5_HEMAN|mmetsp:Transcript_31802/g.76958  ORF Transcript_31802/g.76958 Transcript_31802/m.76958 type:complete len:135 (+) Transcript_31802:109-513(+)